MASQRPSAILVVDDVPEQRYAVARMLARAGYQVMEAGSGREALAAVTKAPALIVLDVHLPDMSGFEVAAAIKSDPQTALIPILHLSATAQQDQDKARGLEHADAYLTQPVAPDVLVATVNALLRSHSDDLALRETVQRLTSHLANVPAAITEWDENFRVKYWSPQAEKMFGWTAAEVLGKSPGEFNFVVEDDVPKVEKIHTELRDGHATRSISFNRNRHKDGTILHCEWYNSSLRTGPGGASNLGITLDVTTRVHYEREISALNRELQRRVGELEALLHAMPVGIAIADDPACRTIRPNPALARILGIPQRPNVSMSAPPPERPRMRYFRDGRELEPEELPQQVVGRTGQELRDQELEFERPDGSRGVMFGNTTPLFDESGNIRGSVAAWIDVTERRRMEEQSRQREQTLRLAFRAAGMWSWAVDLKSMLVTWSEVAEALRGDYPVSTTFQEWLAGIHLDDRERVRRSFEAAARGEQEYEAEFRVVRDGEVRWLYGRGTLVRDSAGRPERMIGVGMDMTARKRAEEAVQNQRQLLETIVDHLPACVLMLEGPELKIRLVNPAYQAIAPGKPMIGRTLEEVWPEVGPEVPRIFRQVLASGTPYHVEDQFFRIRRSPDGPLEPSYFSWAVHRVQLPEGGWGLLNTAWETTQRKNTEEALHISERRLRAIMDTVPDPIFLKDKESRVILANRATFEVIGKPPEQVLGKTDLDFYDDARTGQAMVENDRRVMAAGAPQLLEEHVEHGAGTRTFLSTKAPYRDDDGRIIGIAAIARDITDRKQLEQERQRLASAVQQERDRLSALLNSITDEIWYADAEGKLTLVNPAVVKEFGPEIGEKKDVRQVAASFEVYRPDGTPRPLEEAPPLRALRGEVVVDLEEIVRTPASGQSRHRRVSAAPVRNSDGTIIGSVSVVRDITQRKQAEEALRDAEERFQIARQAAGLGIYDYDVVSGALQWDRTVRELWGVGPDEPVNYETFLSCVHPDDRAPTQAAVNAALDPRGDGNYHAEYRVINRSDQTERWIAATGQVTFSDGKPFRLVGTVQDITERKRTEEALRASEKLAATGKLAAALAHEINNPLAAITNLVYLMDHDPGLSSVTRDYLSMAVTELDRVAHITRSMLSFYRHPSAPAPMTISRTVEGVVNLHRPQLHGAGVELDFRVKGEYPAVGFAPEIQQIVSNLLLNAMESMSHGGRVLVEVRAARCWSGGSVPGTRVLIADSGPGIPREHRRRLFEPFYSTKGGKGTGLGLWVCTNLAERNRGSLRFRTSTHPDRHGTCFCLFLPDATQRRQATAAQAGQD